MKQIMLTFYFSLLLLANHGLAHAIPILDDYSTATTWMINGGEIGLEWQQRTQAYHPGTLVGVDLFFFDPGVFRLFVNKGAGWQNDFDEFSSQMTVTETGWSSFDVSSSLISLVMGEEYVIGVSGLGVSGSGDEVWLAGNGNHYPLLYKFYSDPVAEAMPSFSFKTYIDDSFVPPPVALLPAPTLPSHTPTPEPGTLLLLVSGLSGMALLRNRKDEK